MAPNAALDSYLSDHLAGASAGCELAQRIASTHDDHAPDCEMRTLASDIEADRETLVQIRDRLGFGDRPLKAAAGWVGEKVTRLKLNDPVTGDHDLTRLLEFETLGIGIEGKIALWRALEATGVVKALTAIDLDHLIQRGEDQRAVVERHRLDAARAAFAD